LKELNVDEASPSTSRTSAPHRTAAGFGGLRVVSTRALHRYFDNNARLGATNDIAEFAAWIQAQDATAALPEPSPAWEVTQPYLAYHAWKPGFLELPTELRAPFDELRRGQASPGTHALEAALEAAGFRTSSTPDLPLLLEKTDVFPAMQNRVELELLLGRLLERRPRCVVEIGTARGGSLYCLTQVAAPNALVVSIDLAGGPCGGGQTELECEVFRSFAGPEQSLVCLRGRSFEAGTQNALRSLLDGRGIELLFIDGDHRYDSVRTDFFAYRELMAPGGLVVLHDVLALADVNAFWRELEALYPTELIRDPAGVAPLSHAQRDAVLGSNERSSSLAYGLGLVLL
jgi:predicted O-methyltransferase YrrM